METLDGPIRVEKVDQKKDLCVTFDNTIEFGERFNSKVTKANHILVIFKTFTYIDLEMFLN